MNKDRKFDLDDISVIPAISSEIESRSWCKTKTRFNVKDYKLPLMASPMDTVVCEENLERYILQNIVPCMPRGAYSKDGNRNRYFQAFGLYEIEAELYDNLKSDTAFYNYPNVLIDIANGHMAKLVNIVKDIKAKYPEIQLMVGNVAHPLTYKNLAMAGADYVRCSIGTGAGCTTAANVAINYPIGSLISECAEIKADCELDAKIVADGGARDFSDIIKALVLGADYVMMGSIFNKAMESAGFNYLKTSLGRIRIKHYDLARSLWKWGFPIYKKYRGMSTKEVQRSWGKTKLVTAEGITKYQKVEYTLEQWTNNFNDYIKSNMSYCGARNLKEYVGQSEWVFITERARKRFEK